MAINKDKIKENLYEAQNLLYTELIIKEFKENKINIEGFLEVIEFYILNFEFLKFNDTVLIKKLYEKLLYFNKKSTYKTGISLYSLEISSCITFITRQKKNLFNKEKKIGNTNHYKKENILNIDSINIKNFFSIQDIELNNLKDKKEIYIVGENGDGKTLLLQAITIGLKGKTKGAVVELLETQQDYKIETINSENKSNELNNNMFAYGSSRDNHCNAEEDETGYLTLFNSRTFNVTLKDAEQWLIYLDHKDNQLLISMVKSTLKRILGDEVETYITPDEVSFTERGAKNISFKQLSAGYRSVITFICDLIEKLSNNQSYILNIKEFQGIVLIDEVELHLHPKWQYSFMNKLRETFPLIQFIVTTHSPTVLLGAGMESVYYRIYKDNGVVKVSEEKEVKNNFLNDIQTTIFGFDVNEARIYHPTQDDKKRQQRAKKNLLNLIKIIEDEES